MDCRDDLIIKYKNIIYNTIVSIIGENNIDRDIVTFLISGITNDEELEIFFSCLNKYGISKDVILDVYDLFVYKENEEYCFIENNSKCNIDENRIIGEYLYSVGFDYYSDSYVVQFERV